MVLASLDESETVVWTDQVAEAAAVARPILEAGDDVGARMAFRDAYERIVRERVDEPRWFPSLGSDAGRREADDWLTHETEKLQRETNLILQDARKRAEEDAAPEALPAPPAPQPAE